MAFLNETIAFYSEDVTKRAVTGVGCFYRMGEKGEKRCAIGRHIPDERYGPYLEGCSVSSAIIQRVLPAEITALGVNFLSQMQSLHDNDRYWDSDGLSEDGLGKRRAIEEIFGLDSNV